MPYIKLTRKKALLCTKMGSLGTKVTGLGELTYVLTDVILQYLGPVKPSFQLYAGILGVLEATKAEFVERRLKPYEKLKREENGDVY